MKKIAMMLGALVAFGATAQNQNPEVTRIGGYSNTMGKAYAQYGRSAIAENSETAGGVLTIKQNVRVGGLGVEGTHEGTIEFTCASGAPPLADEIGSGGGAEDDEGEDDGGEVDAGTSPNALAIRFVKNGMSFNPSGSWNIFCMNNSSPSSAQNAICHRSFMELSSAGVTFQESNEASMTRAGRFVQWLADQYTSYRIKVTVEPPPRGPGIRHEYRMFRAVPRITGHPAADDKFRDALWKCGRQWN